MYPQVFPDTACVNSQCQSTLEHDLDNNKRRQLSDYRPLTHTRGPLVITTCHSTRWAFAFAAASACSAASRWPSLPPPRLYSAASRSGPSPSPPPLPPPAPPPRAGRRGGDAGNRRGKRTCLAQHTAVMQTGHDCVESLLHPRPQRIIGTQRCARAVLSRRRRLVDGGCAQVRWVRGAHKCEHRP